MAAKLYRCRDNVKRFFKDEYKENLIPYKKIISDVAKDKNIGELEAMRKICEDDVIKNNGWTLMLLMAAALELIEPDASH